MKDVVMWLLLVLLGAVVFDVSRDDLRTSRVDTDAQLSVLS